MRSFFRGLEAHGARYLLISGQASVLYGAAVFSEDIDLWVEPTSASIRALSLALRDAGALVYKLTPPLETRLFRRGHGFHFRIPEDATGLTFLDVMGRPPRVGAFGAALRRSVRMATSWGSLPVVSIEDLVELKKTRRLADYDIITNLARVRLSASGGAPGGRLLAWALRNCFRVEDAAWILDAWPRATDVARRGRRASLGLLALRRAKGAEVDPDLFGEVQSKLAQEIAELQRKDVAWWSGIIGELREMRRAGTLLPEGGPVPVP